MPRLVNRILNRIIPQNKIFIKQVGYWFYQKQSLRRLVLNAMNGKVAFLPSYIRNKEQPPYIVHDWDPSGSEVFITDGYADWGLERIFMSTITHGGCLIDVGAHSGFFAHLLYDKCSHFVNIETSKKCFSECLEPLQRLWADKVVVNVNAPAFNKEDVEVVIQQAGDGWGMSEQLGQESHGIPLSEVVMRTVTVDALYARL